MQAFVEHLFRVIKRQFSLTQVSYRGLKKNDKAVHTLFALVNVYQMRRILAAI